MFYSCKYTNTHRQETSVVRDGSDCNSLGLNKILKLLKFFLLKFISTLGFLAEDSSDIVTGRQDDQPADVDCRGKKSNLHMLRCGSSSSGIDTSRRHMARSQQCHPMFAATSSEKLKEIPNPHKTLTLWFENSVWDSNTSSPSPPVRAVVAKHHTHPSH